MRWLISDKIKNDFSSTATEITDHPEGTPGGKKKEEEEKETADSSSKSQSGSNKKVEEEERELKTNTSPACSHVSPLRLLSSRSSGASPGPSWPPTGTTPPPPSSPSRGNRCSAAPREQPAPKHPTEVWLRPLEPGALTLGPAPFCDPHQSSTTPSNQTKEWDGSLHAALCRFYWTSLFLHNPQRHKCLEKLRACLKTVTLFFLFLFKYKLQCCSFITKPLLL